MPQQIRVGHKQLMAEAEAEVSHITAAEAVDLMNLDDVVIVDIRDVREIQREGRIPGSVHAPRGMLEFWVDPESPYHKEVFSSGKTFIFFCAAGWRSALATKTVQDMGLEPVKHIDGGFGAWKKAGLPIEMPEEKTA